MNFKITNLDAATTKEIKKEFLEDTLSTIGELNASEYLVLKLYDNDLVGKIVFRNFWKSLEVKYLIVKKEFRKKGYGKILIDKAVEIAKEKFNSKIIYLDTLSYQALDFL